MGSIRDCLKSFLRAVVLLALTLFVALPNSGSTVPDLVFFAVNPEKSDSLVDPVDDGHEHSDFELIFGHCDDGLDCTAIAAFFSQPTLTGSVTLEQRLTRPSVHKLASLSWPYDAPPPRILT